jgi:hypothetical protein
MSEHFEWEVGGLVLKCTIWLVPPAARNRWRGADAVVESIGCRQRLFVHKGGFYSSIRVGNVALP